MSGQEIHKFTFKQFEDKTSYEKINVVVEEPAESSLLVIKKCSYEATTDEETVEERCYLYLLMVFYSTSFTSMKILITDRGGSTASSEIDYTSEELARSEYVITFPGPDGPTSVEISPYLLDLIAILLAIFGTYLVIKRTKIIKILRIIYG